VQNHIRKGILAAAAATLGLGGVVARGAADRASDPAYAAEAGGAWKGQYDGAPDANQNPPGTDNGGSGFGIWNFSGGYHLDGQSPYGTTNHFIDGVDFAHSAYNDLGPTAFGLTDFDGDFATTVATRPFAAPMSIGDVFGVRFDTPATYNTDGNDRYPFAIISFKDITGRKTFDIEAGKNQHLGDFPWRYDHAGGTDVDTGISPDATSDGSALSFQLTSATTGILTFDLGGPNQQVIPISLLNGAPAAISFTMYEGGSSNLTGEYEFFFNDLSLAGAALGNQWHKPAGGSNAGNWGDAGQWTGGVVPDAIDASANFLGHASVDANATITVDADRRVGILNFDNASYSYTLAGSNVITLDVTTGEAQINATAGNHVIEAPLLLADDTTMRVDPAGGSLTISSVLASSAKLTKIGDGTLIVAGTTAYTGGTFVDEGTLQVGNGATGGSIAGDIVVGEQGALVFNRSDASTYAGVISGVGGFTKLGAGTLSLTGNNTYTGITTVSGGTLQIGNGGTSGFVPTDVAVGAGATLSFNRSDDFQFVHDVTGAGSVLKLGGNTLTFTDDIACTGGTTIAAGTLAIGGTSGSIAGNVTNNGTLALNRTIAYTVPGDISGTGNVVKNGGSITVTFTGNSTYSGGTTVNAGTLQIGNGGTTGSLSGNVSVANGTTIRFSRSDNVGFPGAISGSGNLSKMGAGTLTLTGNNTQTGGTTVSAGTLQVGNGGTTGSLSGNVSVANGAALKFNRSDDLIFGGVVSGSGNLSKLGAGTLILSGNDTYTGGTTVLVGALQVGNGGTTGAIAGNVSVASASTLRFNRSDNVTFGGVISGAGAVTKLAGNSLTLTASNTYTGVTTVTAGTLVAANADALAGGVVTVAAGALARAQAGLPKAVTVSTLTTGATGKFDLANNSMVIRGMTVPQVQALIQTSFNAGHWDGAGGLTSSTAAGSTITAIGLASNGVLNKTSFKGVQGLTSTDVLVKCTYYGDADLSGNTTLDDFTLFLRGYQNAGTTWVYGDFDYSGTVTLDDFTLFLAGYQQQGAPLSEIEGLINAVPMSEAERAAMLAAAAAVPEPGLLPSILVAASAAGLAVRRRRRRSAHRQPHSNRFGVPNASVASSA
jgi:autotransporter-associated beta strand protein